MADLLSLLPDASQVVMKRKGCRIELPKAPCKKEAICSQATQH